MGVLLFGADTAPCARGQSVGWRTGWLGRGLLASLTQHATAHTLRPDRNPIKESQITWLTPSAAAAAAAAVTDMEGFNSHLNMEQMNKVRLCRDESQ